MSKAWAVVLVLFCFSLTTTAINDLGIFDIKLNEVGISVDDINDTKTEIFEVSGSTDDGSALVSKDDTFSIFSGVELIIKAITLVGAALAKTVIIYFVLLSYGVPIPIALMIQTLVTLIEGVAIAEFASARRITR